MSESVKKYAIRYFVEPWDKPPPSDADLVMAGVRASPDNYGYTDSLFLASIIKNVDGSVESVLLMDSDNGPNPSEQMLRLVRDQINLVLRARARAQ